MKKILLMAFIGLVVTTPVFAGGMDDDPLVYKFMIDQLETHNAGDGVNPIILEGQAWVGKDLNKFWVKIDAEQVKDDTEELEIQALYSRAIAVYWDMQIGIRRDFKTDPERDWLVLGFQGLAPYFYEIDSALFIRENGQTGLRLEFEYEILFSQQWILTPEMQVHFHSKDIPESGIGAGLSDSEASIRLRYEIKREFAPFIGYKWSNKYGKTSTYAKESGAQPNDSQFMIGFRAWF